MTPRRCPRCQTALPSDAPEGLCPRCLLHAGLASVPQPATTAHTGFTPPSPAELAPHFPQLEVLELLGQGGMGAVYKARQTKLDRLVALKVLPPAAGQDPAFAERFLREARALARLSHPHIVGVHDFGDVGGLYYLLMEYVDGVNLRQALGAGQLQPQQALAVVGEVCTALQYAHDEGVVHRDIKPENILLDRKGHVKIADFGLAKMLGQTVNLRLTGTQQVMGTPHYMAPEQVERPLAVDHRADIYALGVVFYELLTGQLPLGKFAPPSQKAGVDARLDHVVQRALEREPDRRYQQVSEVKVELESIASAAGSGPGLNRQTWFRLLLLASVLWVAAVAAAGAAWSWQVQVLGWGVFTVWVCLVVGWWRQGAAGSRSRKSREPFPGLSREEDDLRQLLLRYQDHLSSLWVLPEVPGEMLATARKSCRAPRADRVLGLLDFTGEDSGEDALLFGCRGLYYHNREDSVQPGAGSIPYEELPQRSFVNHGQAVYLGKEQFLCPDPDVVDCEQLAALLAEVRTLLVSRPASDPVPAAPAPATSPGE
jgi:tRNA A-37 threonylcarbamoyl transferase component Bud32